ncbi:MAG: GGDEF domain-containing protein [Pseudomonadota bacterium]
MFRKTTRAWISQALIPRGWLGFIARTLLASEIAFFVFLISHYGFGRHTPSALEFAGILAGVAAPILIILWALKHTADSLEDMRQIAMTDGLTGLLNRRGFILALEEVEQGAFLAIDVDHFKYVNDRYGHAAGDEVLKEMANHLKRNVRKTDLVARIGGEEFGLFLPDCDSLEVDQIGERLCRGFVVFNERLTAPIKVTMSIGVAYSMMAGSIDDMIQNADRALYQAKRSGRARLTFWQPPAGSRH